MFLDFDTTDWHNQQLCPDIKKALNYAGVEGFYSHFLALSEDDINGLTVPHDGGDHAPLPVVHKRLLIMLSSIYQNSVTDFSTTYG